MSFVDNGDGTATLGGTPAAGTGGTYAFTVTASNAAEALLVATSNAIDLLIVDVVMPGKSGPQLVEELAARGSGGPTLYISGYGADEVSSRGFETEQTALIEKPCS